MASSHICLINTVGLKIGDEVDKAWEEKLKRNVKEMVKNLVAMDNTRAKTVLILKEDDDTLAENIEALKNLSNKKHDHIV